MPLALAGPIPSNQPRIASGHEQVRLGPIEKALSLCLLPFKQGRGSLRWLWAGRLRSACSRRFKIGADHYAWSGFFDISTMGVSSVASVACLDGSVGRGPTFLRAACLARSLIPNFLVFVFTATRCAAFSALVFAPVLPSGSGADFLCGPFRASKPSPFVPTPVLFACLTSPLCLCW